MANTVVDYILNETKRHSGVLRFVLPSYPSIVLFRIGTELAEEFNRILDLRVDWRYEIAYRLGKEWKDGPSTDQAIYRQISDMGWYNQDDNLTRLRNTTKEPDSDCLVILLAGYEHIDDRASLRDFFHLNQDTVWNLCLGGSFYPWVEACLQDYVNPDGSEKEIEQMARIFKDIYGNALTDILGVSCYLEQLDLSAVMTCNDAYRLILSNLAPFKLPNVSGLISRYRTKRSFASYVQPAQRFFNYSMFLSPRNRKNALQKISGFRKVHGGQELEPNTLGSFGSLESMLAALQEYITNRSGEARNRLLTADFVYLHDKILKFRPKKKKQGKKTRSRGPKRLFGLPPEVFLRALWITLGDFKKESRDALFTEEMFLTITMQSTAFQHNLEDVHSREKVRSFLRRILGGIDDFLESQLKDFGKTNGSTTFTVRVKSNLLPDESDAFSCRRNVSAEPRLKFKIVVASKGGETSQREFYWMLPEDHQSRLLDALYLVALDQYRGEDSRNYVPVFTIPYMPEIFMATDEETVSRLFGTALRTHCSLTDIMSAEGFDNSDPIKPLLNDLSVAFQRFLGEYVRNGFFVALDSRYSFFEREYHAVFERYLRDNTSGAGPLLLKSFMFVGDDGDNQRGWLWNCHQRSMVVTPLHPALLEMINDRHAFLCKGFCFYARRDLKDVRSGFLNRTWDQLVDLSRIKWPVCGTLKSEALVLDTNVRSYDYFHLVGECDEDPASINAHLLLDYGDGDEEDITDTDLFRETRASALIQQILSDYHTLHGYADDGLSIAAYCGSQVQPFVSGIDRYLSSILGDRDDRVYTLQLTIFSDSGDDSSVMRWVNAWKERWQESEAGSRRHYGNCKISIAYRVVSRDRHYDQFCRLLQRLEADVIFFMDFIKSGASRFLLLSSDSAGGEHKFPILEKISCREVGAGRDHKRRRILSNERFKMGTLHAQVMAHISESTEPGRKYVVASISDFQTWVPVIDTAHQHSAWVACIDPSIDEQLLQKAGPDGVKREVIGFGTGVGSHGENNYTVSTEQFSLTDIKNKISAQIARLFEFSDTALMHRIAESLIREASYIGGLSIVKATGSSEYVRDYIAYALVRKLLPADSNAFCDEIISLDALQHWFDGAPSPRRPDILRLQATIIGGYFSIKAEIMECKLAQRSDGHLEKARQQIESGLKQLIACFQPRRDNGTKERPGARPDQRYWWMQLHRLIASKGKVRRSDYNEALQALERLSEGYFNITWRGAAVAFWTDVEGNSMVCEGSWDINVGDKEIRVSVATGGKAFIPEVCLKHGTGDIFMQGRPVSFEYERVVGTSDIATADTLTGLESRKDDEGGLVQEGVSSNGGKQDIRAGDAGACVGKTSMPARKIPMRVLLGGGTGGGRQVYWEFGHPDLSNRHVLVFGASGTGKTYTVQALLAELAKSRQNSLIMDYTNGFTPNQLEPIMVERLNPKQHVVRREPLPINPFRRQCDFIDDLELEEDSATTARRVRDLFSQVYRLGDQQQSALYNAIRNGVDQEENNFNLEGLLERLNMIQQEGGASASPAASLISKLQPFVDMRPFGQEDINSWEKLFSSTDSRCHIVQLAGFMKDTSRLITEFSLFDLYWYYRARGNKDNPKVIVLDEIQNLNHSLSSPLGQLLTEGRKFGISLILATQTLSNLAKDERDRLFQASHKLFFKPADTEIRSFARILADVTNGHIDDWVDRLSSLKRGECYSLGSAFNKATGQLEVGKWFKIKITSLERRY